MAALIYGQKLTKSFGVKRLFQGLTLGVTDHDRIGIIGPNGSGKTTLLRIFAGLEKPDNGTVTRRQYLRMAYVPQQAECSPERTVAEELGHCALESGIDKHECVGRIQEILGWAGFNDGDQRVAVLSGGWRKRLAIACGMVQDPEVMLLDEPTNHLDWEGIRWLEQLMAQAPWPWVMVSHDRWILDHAANTVAEINPRYAEGIFVVKGAYGDFLRQREEHQQTQAQQAQALAGKVRREVEWLRRGPKARTTKAKYRVETAQALQAELAETVTRLRQNETFIDFVGSGRKTKQLIEGTKITKAFGSRPIIQNLEMILSPGMAMGILGHNGSGKSTLLKLLAGELDPDQGTVRHADKLRVVYFDQNRERLDPKMTLRRTLSETGHTVTYRGQTLHVAGWARRFRFQPEQLDLPIDRLSGGEQARAMMARLMLQPADVLLVDEPTNDLDIPAREVLEGSLQEFPGALVLVTHDRYMLSKVCTHFVGLDGKGGCGHFAEIPQWEAWLRRQPAAKNLKQAQTQPKRGKAPRSGKPKKSFTFKEQREYDAMEGRILEAETVRDTCRATIEDPTIASDHVKIQEAYDALKEAEQTVSRLYARWAALEAKHQGSGS